MGYVRSKTRSLGQILHHSAEGSGERPQGHHGPLVFQILRLYKYYFSLFLKLRLKFHLCRPEYDFIFKEVSCIQTNHKQY